MAKFTSLQSILLAALSLNALVSAQLGGGSGTPCARNYTVQAGDFCDAISAAQNVSTYQLATVNSAIIDPTCSNCSSARSSASDSLARTAPPSPLSSRKRVRGNRSSGQYHHAVLLANNPNVDADCTNIYPGEV
ncbi:hypothetical protein BJ912DRAFT_1002031, partial [Pholiota molesta]